MGLPAGSKSRCSQITHRRYPVERSFDERKGQPGRLKGANCFQADTTVGV